MVASLDGLVLGLLQSGWTRKKHSFFPAFKGSEIQNNVKVAQTYGANTIIFEKNIYIHENKVLTILKPCFSFPFVFFLKGRF